MDPLMLAYLTLAMLVLYFVFGLLVTCKLRHIPPVGNSALPFLCWLGVLRSVVHATEILQESYEKFYHTNGVLKHVTLTNWRVLIIRRRFIEEDRKEADDELSFDESVNETLQVDYTLGRASITTRTTSRSSATSSCAASQLSSPSSWTKWWLLLRRADEISTAVGRCTRRTLAVYVDVTSRTYTPPQQIEQLYMLPPAQIATERLLSDGTPEGHAHRSARPCDSPRPRRLRSPVRLLPVPLL
ncbi:uncharacterized protein C8Q71DRAFT_790734 [Rhodofomes roseus]|uniref:Uncharacterized protein n=1 Tax=Rhodofomes roseus TaxID=34475 RepID=A0ABQ8JYJ3_9APHY|nr:uncharacterized protein C8Q71DRAFT_790734 [Rhodofomes roseus]KAH9829371.1 hypothetical protein C8Q71DRAFT_790734 [Rhodofomes roseus]